MHALSSRWLRSFTTVVAVVGGISLSRPVALAESADDQADGELRWHCPQVIQNLRPPCEEETLAGTIGKASVSVAIDTCRNGAVGVYYYNRYFDPIFLTGTVARTGRYELNEKEGTVITGRMTQEGFEGVWEQSDPPKRRKVNLKRVSPEPCDLAGPTILFSDPRWPVTFLYPSALRVTATKDALVFRCRDPRAWYYGAPEFTVSHGHLSDGRFSFQKCKDRWIINDHECDQDDWGTVVNSPMGQGLTLRGSPREWRLYCGDGGYIGQGSGELIGIIQRHTWVEFASQDPDKVIPGVLNNLTFVAPTQPKPMRLLTPALH